VRDIQDHVEDAPRGACVSARLHSSTALPMAATGKIVGVRDAEPLL
jgi:hypothetical protein